MSVPSLFPPKPSINRLGSTCGHENRLTPRSMPMKPRCAWAGQDRLYVQYHDLEWGVPLHDDRRLFEFLVLESAQAGLSWITILRKRENYREAFDGFDPRRVAEYGRVRIERLLADPGIVRNRRKIEA